MESFYINPTEPLETNNEVEKKKTDEIIADLQKELHALRLTVEQIRNTKEEKKTFTSTNNYQKPEHVKKKITKWTAFSKHMMSFLNDVLSSPNQEIKTSVVEELKLEIKDTGEIFSQYNDKEGNAILLKGCSSYAGNVQGIMKHCGKLWQNLSGDSKDLWQQYSEKCNNGLNEE